MHEKGLCMNACMDDRETWWVKVHSYGAAGGHGVRWN